MSAESSSFDIQGFLKDLPNLPGVYRHISADGEVLYVGKAKDLKKAQELMHAHEQIISELTGERTVKDRLFSDFQGGIKSLGAWGGDFIMVAFDQNPESYFQSKGYSTILSYKDMVL